jgi:iron complex transport system substrate-binding protein
VEITTAFGTTTIEAAPEKVAVIGYAEGDTVLALGTVPVSFFEFAFPGEVGGPWATELLDGQTPVLLKGELNVEQVAALQPDLIIGINQALTQQQYDQLSKIAPTLARPAEYTDYGVPPKVQAEMIGQALGQPAEIAALGADVADQVATAAADHPEFDGKTVSVVWPNEDGSWFVWSTTDPRVQLMESLGLVQSPQIAALGTDAFFHTVSAENTEQIDADVIVVLDVGGVKSTVEANPVFNSLDAVKNGQVVWVTDPNVIGALSYGSVLSLPYAVDAIVPALAETIGGAAVSSPVVTTS